MQRLLASVLLCSAAVTALPGITKGSSWKYLDNNTNQGTAWRSASFNDAAWASGNAQVRQ
jgi:hypothetical protein